MSPDRMVDERDFQLLARLLREPLASHEALGRDVGLSGTAMKTRLNRLAEEGVFNRFRGLPAAAHFGRMQRVFVFRGDHAGPEGLRHAVAVDPVVSANLRQDGMLAVMVFARSEADEPPADLVGAFGPPVFRVSPRFAAPRPAKSSSLRSTSA